MNASEIEFVRKTRSASPKTVFSYCVFARLDQQTHIPNTVYNTHGRRWREETQFEVEKNDITIEANVTSNSKNHMNEEEEEEERRKHTERQQTWWKSICKREWSITFCVSVYAWLSGVERVSERVSLCVWVFVCCALSVHDQKWKFFTKVTATLHSERTLNCYTSPQFLTNSYTHTHT